MLKNKKIVLGVTGGIAAYKAVALTSKLTQKGAQVKVILTENTQKFITPLSFQAISRQPVYTDTFLEEDPKNIAHIDLADWADFFLIAPATAHTIGKMANGLADDMLTTTLLATTAPVYIAPAMNVHMYENRLVQQNMQKLDDLGFHFIEPGDGYLACGYVGKGRLEEPEEIVHVLEQHQTRQQQSDQRLKGKKVLISAGPTREPIDPVRFFTNHSSGKMGYSLAEAAENLGAEVHLVSGPVDVTAPRNVQLYSVETAEEMYKKMTELYDDMDIVIKAAAVADYRPLQTFDQKLKKQAGALQIEMERTKDILQALGERKKQQYLVGFAAETNDIRKYGLGKLEKKNLDAIIINDVSQEGIGFHSNDNEVTIITKHGKEKTIPKLPKKEIAKEILQLIDEEVRKKFNENS
ncbi:phosphopantothenoylcysteine decarboxylase/phosphopantothenate--cysteine ligase [Gracilibacillus halotolerans]|uniref:Coenzyme A biosynthesis bifunctional protein CoaBC n=1 Tax=Gracilibacillus halotolerans TaxID=74386 RepID=A0A841RBV4_9BACI|nr:bifunctional phosphopantothenoylcysteine decarboxylase/phosphopantothenate--cysteine ligase CoaBC [Gracilibacillus halotolerans]MBB6511390.1 phosphopantothenoylcysteine decarboxylase/phosphopantothenate--cysteine ligase [Gracilibacillus halotolerans]